MTLEQELENKLRGWVEHSRRSGQAHTAIPNTVVDDMVAVLRDVRKSYDRRLIDRTLAVYIRGFESHAVVQDVIDEIRKLGE